MLRFVLFGFSLFICLNSFSNQNKFIQKLDRIEAINCKAKLLIDSNKLDEAEMLLWDLLPSYSVKIKTRKILSINIQYTYSCNLLFSVVKKKQDCKSMFKVFLLEKNHFHYYKCYTGIKHYRIQIANEILELALIQKEDRIARKMKKIIFKLNED